MSLLPALVLLSALAAAAAGTAASAAGPQDYFHGGANKYVAGRHQEALLEVEEGVRRYPDDERLKSLAAHLRQLKDQKKQDQGQAGDQGSDQGDDEKKQPGDDDQAGKGEQEKDKEDDKQAEAGKEKGKDGADTAGQAMAEPPKGEMSKEEAERLLNSYQDDEKKEHRRMGRRSRKVEVQEDW